MFVFCDCRVLSDRGLCNELITRTEDFYRLWCVVNEEALAPCVAVEPETNIYKIIIIVNIITCIN